MLRRVGRSWSTEQVVSLAPDPSALKAGQALATPRKWNLLGRDEAFVWGLAQGSGAEPYQVQVDLSEPAFKCSCPSRKFPCKHGLGLLLLFATQPNAIAAGEPPQWVTEWATKRAQKVAKQESKVAAPEEPVDPAAHAKRRDKRAANVAQGVAFLDGWLRDLVRRGLSSASSEGYEFWDTPARRLIDTQAPGLARRVERLGYFVGHAAENPEQAVAELGRLHLLLAAARRRAELPPDWQQELDVQVGWTVGQEELRQQSGIADTWLVAAQAVQEDERLITRTSYLFSPHGRVGKLLEFSHASQPSVATLALGRWIEAELVFYPGVNPQRAILKSPPRDADGATLPPLTRCDDVLRGYAAALAQNPLTEDLPVILRAVPQRQGDHRWLRDAVGETLPIAGGFPFGWELLACSGGEPVDVVGTWDGFTFTSLSIVQPDGVIDLAPKRV